MTRIEVKNSLVLYLKNQIDIIKNQIENLSIDAQNDAKSSAGDKHETGLAMMHLEQEKLNAKLANLLGDLEKVVKLPDEKMVDQVMQGSVVRTNKGVFYVSVASIALKINNQQIMFVSSKAPIMNVLANKKSGDEITFNNITYKILEIL